MITLSKETKSQAIGMALGLFAFRYAVKNKRLALPYYVVGSFVGTQVTKAIILKNENKKLNYPEKVIKI